MGSSSSKKPTNNDNLNQTPSTAEGELDDAKLEEFVDEARKQIKNDKSFENVIHVFSKMLRKPDLSSFERTVGDMKNNWETIFTCLKELIEMMSEESGKAPGSGDSETKESGDVLNANDMNQMKAIYNDYCGLLFETQRSMKVLVAKCGCLKSDVEILLDVIKTAKKNGYGELSGDDKLTRDECADSITKWVANDELVTLVEKWGDMENRLQATKESWEKKAPSLKRFEHKFKKKMSSTWKKIAVGLAVVTVLAGSVTAIVLSCGIAAPAIITAEFVILKAVIIGEVCIIGAAMSCAAVSAAKAVYEEDRARTKAMRFMSEVTNLLQKMIVTSRKLQADINDMASSQDTVKVNLDNTFSKAESVRRMEKSLKEINKHLKEYMEQGNSVIKAVKAAIKTMIHANYY